MLIYGPAKTTAWIVGAVVSATVLSLYGCASQLDSANSPAASTPAADAPSQSTPSADSTANPAANSPASPTEEKTPAIASAPNSSNTAQTTIQTTIAETPTLSQPPQSAEAQTAPDSQERFSVQPPASEVVPADAKQAATTLIDSPLPLQVQPYSLDELFAVGGGGCGMSLWRADGSPEDSFILFNGIGEGYQLLMKLNGEFVAFQRIEGKGPEFYGQFTQQRFSNLPGKLGAVETSAGEIEVMTEIEFGAAGEIESVAIDRGRVVLTQQGIRQEIPVQGDAGC